MLEEIFELKELSDSGTITGFFYKIDQDGY